MCVCVRERERERDRKREGKERHSDSQLISANSYEFLFSFDSHNDIDRLNFILIRFH